MTKKQTPRKVAPAAPRVDPIMGAFAARVEELGWTQQRVARLVGVTQGDISKVLRGVTQPPLPMVRRLARVLGMELSVAKAVHPFQEYNVHGNSCHYPGCQLTREEHADD